jgi:hypothetical protein
VHPPQRFFGLLAFGDVIGDALQEQRTALVVADDLAFAVDPDGAAVPRQKAVFGAKMHAACAGLGKLGLPAFAVVRMKLGVPEDGVCQPLLLREAQKRLNLRADVQLVQLLIEGSHEGDGGQLFDQSAIAELGLVQTILDIVWPRMSLGGFVLVQQGGQAE